MKIILDAMGGDHAPEAPVLGAVQAARDFGAQITLVGMGDKILEVMRAHNITDLPDGIEIANAEEVVDMHDDPANVVRQKKNSSMMMALKMLADGDGDACIVQSILHGLQFSGTVEKAVGDHHDVGDLLLCQNGGDLSNAVEDPGRTVGQDGDGGFECSLKCTTVHFHDGIHNNLLMLTKQQ